jgi:hypothetical protein
MKMVSILLPENADLGWVDALPQGIFITTQDLTADELADARAMGIIGQSAGLAFWRAHRDDTPLEAPPPHMLKREKQG